MKEELGPTDGIAMYRSMRLIRRFEELVVELVDKDEIAGVTHEYIGQEAVAVGICHALAPGDVLTSTHRGHGHLLARGADPGGMMAELMGRSSGLNRGCGGSMHIADLRLGILGANGIVAAGTAIAAGAAWATKVSGSDRVAVAFFGDGALNQGVLHEAMNLAALWDLPVIFCCENNGYAVTTAAASSSASAPTDRASAAGILSEVVDGMDPGAVWQAARRAVSRARTGHGPTFLDCVTYRFVGHHTAERTMKLQYRTDAELKYWQARDPLEVWPAKLRELGALTLAHQQEIDSEIEMALEAAIEAGRSGPQPNGADALAFVYASPTVEDFPSPSWRTTH